MTIQEAREKYKKNVEHYETVGKEAEELFTYTLNRIKQAIEDRHTFFEYVTKVEKGKEDANFYFIKQYITDKFTNLGYMISWGVNTIPEIITTFEGGYLHTVYTNRISFAVSGWSN